MKSYKTIFSYFDVSFTVWFALEITIRFICCPDKLRFIKSIFNILDLICIIAYLILIFATYDDTFKPIIALRLIRMFFVFKLSKYLESLKILVYTVKESIRELMALLIYLGIGILFFSSLLHFCEKDYNREFESIPSSFWWAFITMTTVGYGIN